MPPKNNNKRGRPQRYVLWQDWENWLIKEWHPFKNDEWHPLKRDVMWVKFLLSAVLVAIIGAAIAILTRG